MSINKRWVILFTFLIMLSLACNLPTTPKQALFPTPNRTITAIMAQATILTRTAPTQQETKTTPSQVTGAATATLASSLPYLTNTPIPTMTVTQTGSVVPTVAVTQKTTHTITPATTAKRSGTKISATFLSKKPVIDGVWDEWTTPAYPAAYINFGLNNWTDRTDLEGSFRIGWDNDNLYIAVKVIDDKYVQQASGYDIYMGDSIEILLDRDLAGDFFSTELNADDFQLGISPGNPNTNGVKEAYLWFPKTSSGSRTANLTIGSISSNGVYRVEAAIPWTVFGITPAGGQAYGFSLGISDNDAEGTIIQQSLASNQVGRRLTNPTTWSELVLVK